VRMRPGLFRELNDKARLAGRAHAEQYIKEGLAAPVEREGIALL